MAHPSVDKPSQPPDLLHKPSSSQPEPQKSPPFIDASPKPSLTPGDSFQRAPFAEKPQLSDLPPKPLLRDLPLKLPLSDRPGSASVAMEMQGSKMSENQSPIQQDVDKSPPGAVEVPVPLPRKINSVRVFQMITCFHRT